MYASITTKCWCCKYLLYADNGLNCLYNTVLTIKHHGTLKWFKDRT